MTLKHWQQLSERALDRAARYLRRAIILFFFTSFFGVSFYRFEPVGFTPLMLLRSGKWHKKWVPLEKISTRMQSAVIAAEDEDFFEHNGVDWKSVEKAIEYNHRSTKVRGASTITQQVAKNVFLWPGRSWIRKGVELYFTGLIEALWSKERILEVYLNVVELGDGVYGVEAAAQIFFHKHASELNSDEAALLAASLPNPRKYIVSNPSGYLRFRQAIIKRRLARIKLARTPK